MFSQVFTLKKLKIIIKVQIALFSLRNVSFRQKVMLIFSIKLIEKKFLTLWILCQHTGDGKNWLFLATSNPIYELRADQSLDLELNNFCLLKSSGGCWEGFAACSAAGEAEPQAGHFLLFPKLLTALLYTYQTIAI